jgi:carbonic anhydrase
VTEAIDELLAGYRRFRDGTWPERRLLLEDLAARGQRPLAAVIACADSRLDPSAIFDAAPGALFVVRNVANLVPPYQPDAAYHGTSAALEFAVKGLGVSTIMVMGHAQCGGVQALMADHAGALTDFVMPWMQIAARAKARVDQTDATAAERQTACEHETVKVSLENLMTFPWVAAAVAEGKLRLQGAYYGIATGVLEFLDADGVFRPGA